MMNKKPVFIMLAILAVIGFTFGQSAADTASAEFTAEISILEPGMASSCPDDFMVENPGNDKAELRVVLGDKAFNEEWVQAKAKKHYNRKGTLSLAKLKGEQVAIDDVATIINKSEKQIRLHCAR
ncbi:MAG: hypothetical protein ACE5G9_11500 [Nitrospinales bacterium]